MYVHLYILSKQNCYSHFFLLLHIVIQWNKSIVSDLFIEIHFYSAFLLSWMLCFFQSFNNFFNIMRISIFFSNINTMVMRIFFYVVFFPQWISVFEYCHHHLISNKSSLVREFLRESVVSSQDSFICSYIFLLLQL